MKILVAGATGAIGQPLIMFLNQAGHEVYGITTSEEKATRLELAGSKAVILDILNKEAVFAAMDVVKPEIVIDMLTHLPKEYTPEAMAKAGPMDAKIRIEGGGNLFAAAEEHGVRRYIAQSCGFWYEAGEGLATEEVLFALNASSGIAAGCKIYQQIEDRTLKSSKLEGIAMRFGFFYGPGTWFNPGDDIANQIINQKFPLIGSSNGIWSFIHIEDAAKAILSALDIPAGPYNIVDDNPLPLKDWLAAFASKLGAPSPLQLTHEEGIQQRGADFTYYAEELRGASNEKAKKTFEFSPRTLEWL